MPAGDLVVSDWQVEVRTTLLGYGSDYELEEPNIGGLGNTVKTRDVELNHDDGSYAAADLLAPRVITLPIVIAKSTVAATGTAFKTLNDTVWAPASSDIQLHAQVPGMGKFYVYGRPRGVSEDLRVAHFGIIRCLLTFVALDPTITYV